MRKIRALSIAATAVLVLLGGPDLAAVDAGRLKQLPTTERLAAAERGDSWYAALPVLYPEHRCELIVDDPVVSLNPATPPHTHRQFGLSVEGRPLHAELWGDRDAERSVLVVGQTHANECAPVVAVDAMRRFDVPYRLWIVGTLNPDGVVRLSRSNANGVDLNADGGAVSQPETRALRSLLSELRPDVVVFLHSPNGFAGPYPSSGPARDACRALAQHASLRCSSSAGSRFDRSRWFLWQMTREVLPSASSLLVETYAISDREVLFARPRPPHRSQEMAARAGTVVLDALAEVLTD